MNATAPFRSVTASVPASSGQGDRDERGEAGTHHPDGGRAAAQRSKETGLRLRAVVECDTLAGQKQREVQRVRVDGLSSEPLRFSYLGLRPRAPALVEREQCRAGGEDEQRNDPGEHELDPAAGALARDAARVEEPLLDRVELRLVRGAPLER